MSSPLCALADNRAGVSLRHGADREAHERKQRTCYHLHGGFLRTAKTNIQTKKILRLPSVSPPGGPLDVHNNRCVYKVGSSSLLCGICVLAEEPHECCAQFSAQGRRSFCKTVKVGMLEDGQLQPCGGFGGGLQVERRVDSCGTSVFCVALLFSL